MPTRAHALIRTRAGRAEPVARTLRQLPGVAAAVVAGGYDTVATVAGEDPNVIGRLVLSPIHGIAGLNAG